MESIIERNALQLVDHGRGAPRWPFCPVCYSKGEEKEIFKKTEKYTMVQTKTDTGNDNYKLYKKTLKKVKE